MTSTTAVAPAPTPTPNGGAAASSSTASLKASAAASSLSKTPINSQPHKNVLTSTTTTVRSDSAYYIAPSAQQVDLNLKVVCPNCKDPIPNLVEDFQQGDLVCGNCGLVIGDRIIDTRSEWRTFSNEEGGDDPSRVGASADPILGTKHQLDTIIAGGRIGNSAPTDGEAQMRDLGRAHSKSSWGGKSERNLFQAFNEIQVMTEHIGLPRSISDIAKQLYKRVDDDRLLRGKSSEAIVAVCIMIACRQENVPRTFKEICALTKVPKKEVGRVFKALVPLLSPNNSDAAGGANNLSVRVRIMTSEDLMSRFCSNLNLPMAVQKAAVLLANRARDVRGLSGRSPVSVAAACIYMVCHLTNCYKSAKDISSVAGVSEVTIKNAYKTLYQQRHTVLPDELKKQYKVDALPST